MEKHHFSVAFCFFISLFCCSSFCFEFYLDPNSNVINPASSGCINKTEPCRNICEIVDFVNNLNTSVNNYLTIDIYYLSDYSLDENCKINVTNKLNIKYIGNMNSNAITKLNVEQDPFVYGKVETLFHYSLQLSYSSYVLQHIKSNYKFFDCVFDSEVLFSSLQILSFKNSIISNIITIDNVDTVEILDCEIRSNSDFSFINHISIMNTTFNQVNAINWRTLNLNYCNYILIVSCPLYGLATLAGNYIIIKNMQSIGSILISNAKNVDISYSNFIGNNNFGLRLENSRGFIKISNSLFTKCKTALSIQASLPYSYDIHLENNIFRYNVFNTPFTLNTLGSNRLFVVGCLFLRNEVLLNAGAIYLESKETQLIILNSQFIQNIVGRTVSLTDWEQIGNGGALHVQAAKSITIAQSTVFIQNTALRGGAIYTNTKLTMTDSIILQENVGRIAGGGVFSNTSEILNNLNLNNFINNTARFYGPQIASFPSKVELLFSINDKVVEELIVFPGEVFRITLKLEDLVGNQVSQIFHSPYVMVPPEKRISLINVLSTSRYADFYIAQYNDFSFRDRHVETVVFRVESVETLFNITVTKCPYNYEIAREKSEDRFFYCQPKVFPLSAIIAISVSSASIFFIVGIGIGILFIYCCFTVMSKLRRLKKKEKAELEIERKIIDKKIMFGESKIPLLTDFENNRNTERKESFLIPIEEIHVERKIGEGGCGTVYYAKWGDNSIAIKSIKISDEDEANDEFEREVSLLSSLRHPNVVSFYGVSITETSKYMVIEYLSKGSLRQAINYSKNRKEVLTLKKKLNILINISQGMNYLHNLQPNPIIHRDLKPENVLLDEKGVCKVCDFGLSKIIGHTMQTMTTNVGTLFYLSPEMLKGDKPSTITSKLDVYSFAIIMWELLFEESPYSNYSNKINYFKRSTELPSLDNIFLIPSLVVKGFRPPIPFSNEEEKEIWVKEFVLPFENQNEFNSDTSLFFDKYLNLMQQCWKEEPKERPYFSEILSVLLEMKNYKLQ